MVRDRDIRMFQFEPLSLLFSKLPPPNFWLAHEHQPWVSCPAISLTAIAMKSQQPSRDFYIPTYELSPMFPASLITKL